MIIDCILDRKDGSNYNPHEFYNKMIEYDEVFGGIAWDIIRAMDYGEEADVKKALCEYIDKQGYNPAIKDYINSVSWLGEKGNLGGMLMFEADDVNDSGWRFIIKTLKDNIPNFRVTYGDGDNMCFEW